MLPMAFSLLSPQGVCSHGSDDKGQVERSPGADPSNYCNPLRSGHHTLTHLPDVRKPIESEQVDCIYYRRQGIPARWNERVAADRAVVITSVLPITGRIAAIPSICLGAHITPNVLTPGNIPPGWVRLRRHGRHAMLGSWSCPLWAHPPPEAGLSDSLEARSSPRTPSAGEAGGTRRTGGRLIGRRGDAREWMLAGSRASGFGVGARPGPKVRFARRSLLRCVVPFS